MKFYWNYRLFALKSTLFNSILSCNLVIFFSLSQIISFIWYQWSFIWDILSTCFNSSALSEIFRDLKAWTCFSVCFSKAFPKEEFINLPGSTNWLQLEGNISSPVKYWCLSIFLDDNGDIFAAS